MLGGKQTVKKPLSVFLLNPLAARYQWFWVYPQVSTITLDLCMHSLHKSHYVLFLCMSVIVHNGTEHVEQKRRALRGNKISC